MSGRPIRAEAGANGLRPHRLEFRPVSDDGHMVIYRAIVRPGGPLEPVFAVTVATASPKDDQKRGELARFLGQLRAAFLLLRPKPRRRISWGSWRRTHFDPSSEILISAELVSVKAEGHFGVVYAVASAIEEYGGPAHRWRSAVLRLFTRKDAPDHLAFKKSQIFESTVRTRRGHKRKKQIGTVDCSSGSVRMRPAKGYPRTQTAVPGYPKTSRNTRTITVIGHQKCAVSDFVVEGNFAAS